MVWTGIFHCMSVFLRWLKVLWFVEICGSVFIVIPGRLELLFGESCGDLKGWLGWVKSNFFGLTLGLPPRSLASYPTVYSFGLYDTGDSVGNRHGLLSILSFLEVISIVTLSNIFWLGELAPIVVLFDISPVCSKSDLFWYYIAPILTFGKKFCPSVIFIESTSLRAANVWIYYYWMALLTGIRPN